MSSHHSHDLPSVFETDPTADLPGHVRRNVR
ncbi:hypothetical protein Q604_UNBC06576G0001, partial [human gut metagenome]